MPPALLLTPLLINFQIWSTRASFESHRLGLEEFSRAFLGRNFGENLYFLFNWDGRTVNSPRSSLRPRRLGAAVPGEVRALGSGFDQGG